jgi:starch synthase
MHVAAEMSPLASTGGLGNVVGSLSGATAAAGIETTVVLPRYRGIAIEGATELASVALGIGDRSMKARLLQRGESPRLVLVDIPELFDRAELYGEHGGSYADNAARFIALSRAALEVAKLLRPDIVHVHDWQAALLPVYLKEPDAAISDDVRSVLTIHNLAYQGRFWAPDLALTGLGPAHFNPRFLEFFGDINLLKAGILAADAVTTVSPRYAGEILTPQFGEGLDGVLRDRQDDLHGVLNGIDTDEWDPQTDGRLAQQFSAAEMQGKAACKAALQAEVGLAVEPSIPLFGIVTRLAHQKGMDLLLDALPRVMKKPTQWVVLGTGDPALERRLRATAKRHPGGAAACVTFDADLAHRIFAGSDFTVLPSRFEPCGLAQMYAMRFGTIPLATAVGGLADTVIEHDAGEGNGFVIADLSSRAIVATVKRACAVYECPEEWTALRQRAMASDFSWEPSVERYLQIYRGVAERPPAPLPVDRTESRHRPGRGPGRGPGRRPRR